MEENIGNFDSSNQSNIDAGDENEQTWLDTSETLSNTTEITSQSTPLLGSISFETFESIFIKGNNTCPKCEIHVEHLNSQDGLVNHFKKCFAGKNKPREDSPEIIHVKDVRVVKKKIKLASTPKRNGHATINFDATKLKPGASVTVILRGRIRDGRIIQRNNTRGPIPKLNSYSVAIGEERHTIDPRKIMPSRWSIVPHLKG